MIHVNKLVLYHYTYGRLNGTDAVVTNYDDYINFMSNNHSTLLYSIAPYTIGIDRIKDVNIEVSPNKLIEAGKNITKKMFGIEIEQSDIVTRSVKLNKINDEIIPVNKPPSSRFETITHLQTSFDETVIY